MEKLADVVGQNERSGSGSGPNSGMLDECDSVSVFVDMMCEECYCSEGIVDVKVVCCCF